MKPKSAQNVSKAASKGAVKVGAAKKAAMLASAKKAAAPSKPHVVWVVAVKVGGGRSTRTIYGSSMQPKHRTTEEIAAAIAVASAA